MPLVSSKLTNDQLREAYFKNHTTLKSFNATVETQHAPRQTQTHFETTKMNYGKIDETDKNRFENLFSTFVNHDPNVSPIVMENQKREMEPEQKPTPVVNKTSPYQWLYDSKLNDYNAMPERVTKPVETKPQVSRLEIDLRAQMQAQEELIREMKAQLEMTESLAASMNPSVAQQETYVLTDDDEDMNYLEGLLSGNGHLGVSAPSSLGDIFAEIIGNEKESVSNYEPSIFDANVAQLFAEGEDIDKNPSVEIPSIPTPTPVLETELTELTPFPELDFASTMPELVLPELPDLNFDMPEIPESLTNFELPELPPLSVVPSFDLPPFPDFKAELTEPEIIIPVLPVEIEPELPAIDFPVLPEFNLEVPPLEIDLPPLNVANVEPELPVFDLPPLNVANEQTELPTFELPPLMFENNEPGLPNFDLPPLTIENIEPELPAFDLPPLLIPEPDLAMPAFDLPPLPELDFLNETVIKTEKLPNKKENSEPIDAEIEEIGAKKKGTASTTKLKILDGLLIIVLLAIVGLLVFYFTFR